MLADKVERDPCCFQATPSSLSFDDQCRRTHCTSSITLHFRTNFLSSYLIYYSGIWLGSRQPTITLLTITIQMCLFTKENEQLSELSMFIEKCAFCSVQCETQGGKLWTISMQMKRLPPCSQPRSWDDWLFLAIFSSVQQIKDHISDYSHWMTFHSYGAKTRLEQNSNSFITYYK